MKSLHMQLAEKLIEIEDILTSNGNRMNEITLFARNPSNDNQTLILSSEKSNDEIRKALGIVMKSATQKKRVDAVGCADWGMKMDFDEAFRMWLETLDASYKRLRAVHADVQHLNNESKEFKKAFDEFTWIQSQVFQFKNVRHYIESSAYVKNLRDNNDKPTTN